MNDPAFPRRFTAAMRPGAYLRIIAEGTVGAGDGIRVVERPPGTILPWAMCFASTRGIAIRLNDCWRFRACPRAGGMGE